MSKNKTKKNVLKQWWFWLIIAAVIALTLATTLDYTILSGIIRLGCAPGKISKPADYDVTLEKTSADYDVKYESSYENAVMDVYAAKTDGDKPLFVYIHGGYFIGGDKKSAEAYCRTIAKEGYVVANVNYALAPENKYPAQVKQINDAVAFLVKNAKNYQIDTNYVFIGGDSAGCQIASQMGAIYTDAAFAAKLNIDPAISGSQVKGLILLCGLFDMKTVRATHFPFVNTAMWALTDVRDYENYYRIDELSTVKTATKDYPSSMIICGSDDPFYSQSEELRDVLNDLGVDVQTYMPQSTTNKLKHEFARDFSLDEANEAMAKVIDYMAERSLNQKTQAKRATVTFELSTGDVLEVELYSEYAPKTVENFLKYAEDGFYEGTVFHRIIAGRVLQGGGFYFNDDVLTEKAATYPAIKGEFANNGVSNILHHTRGTISMARTNAYNSATSQFFFCDLDISSYDGEYAAFGAVINPEGLEALDRLVNMAVNGETPVEYVTITKVTVERP